MEKQKAKKHILRKIFLVILSLVVLLLLVLIITGRIYYLNSRKMMKKAGYYNPVSAGDYDLNVYITGAENGEHTIVGLSGASVHNYALLMNRVNEILGEKNTLVYPDRAGYGLSDDTLKRQTVERVVDDYRTALKNAGIEAPYVLLPHSYGGVYATYWASVYPDEIEAVIHLDTTPITDPESFNGEESTEYSPLDIAGAAAHYVLGLSRFEKYDEGQIPTGIGSMTEEELKLSLRAENRGYPFAIMSELLHESEECEKVYYAIRKNDVPKLFIEAQYRTPDDVYEYFSYMNDEFRAAGLEPEFDPQKMADSYGERFCEESRKFLEQQAKPYIESVGNAEMLVIPADHYIFLQKPEEVAQACLDFLDKLQ